MGVIFYLTDSMCASSGMNNEIAPPLAKGLDNKYRQQQKLETT
jgi:hypothetical protein